MPGDLLLTDCGDDRYLRRVARAVDRTRIGATATVVLLLSVEALTGSNGLEFFSPTEIGMLWAEHLVELTVIAAILTLAYTLVEQAISRWPQVLLVISCVLLFSLSVVLTSLLYAYYGHGFDFTPPAQRLLADSLRFALPAIFLVFIADVHRRALRMDAAAHAAEISRARLQHDEADQQLALLQAQIEPHFLFNVLANVRRLYRTQPQAGSEMIQSLMRYLRAALPQLRTHSASLDDELELVRAYLSLLKVRMGPRLVFEIENDPRLSPVEFPPMLLVTLVENAVKHGLEPVAGGSVCIRVRHDHDFLHVEVVDDGAGFRAAGNDGKGVGLINVRRQLAARYEGRARLTLAHNVPSGTYATISIPLDGERLAPKAA